MLIIDVARGRFGPLHLGMSMTRARRMLPAKNLWKGVSDTGDLIYCSSPQRDSCSGDVELAVVSACAVTARVRAACTYNGASGPVAEIDLFANDSTNQFLAPETRDAVTLRGIHLGSPIPQIKRRYAITAKAEDTTCASIGAGGPTLTAVVGENTIVFTKLNGVVYGITLFAGKQPEACKH